MGCRFAQLRKALTFGDARTHDDDDEVCQKKVQKFPLLIFIPVSQNQFYIYQPKHGFFQIHNGRGEIWPSKRATKEPSRFWMVVESREMLPNPEPGGNEPT